MSLRAVFVIAATALVTTCASAAVLRVEQDGSGDYVLIQDAVDAAADEDTILIGPGRYDDLQPRGTVQVVSVAYWEDSRSLSFIGTSADSVIIGPSIYAPVGTGPQGIHQHARTSLNVTVDNLTFANLQFGVVGGDGVMRTNGARFYSGDIGLFVQDPDSCVVKSCSFQELDGGSIAVFRAGHVEVTNCTLTNAQIYFGGSPNANIRDCVVTEGGFVVYSDSGGKIERCRTQCGTSTNVYIDSDLRLELYDNTFVGGGTNLTAGWATIVAERNSFLDPTEYANFELYNASVSAHGNDIRARAGANRVVNTWAYPDGNAATIDFGNNYWFDNSTAAALDSLIYDGNDDPNIHVIVNYEPIRTESVPVKKESLGGLKALFLGR